jgi:hypothetical protein
MNERISDRVFGALGIASVVLMYAAVAIGAAGGRQFATISSSPAHIADVLAKPAGTAVWVGAYIELLSFGCFLAFAAWACARLGGGVVGQIARSAATGYVTLSMVSLGLMDAIAYRSGKGMDLQLGSALITVNEALYACTWFLAVFFLLAVGALALSASRRALGGSAVAIALIQLVTTAASLDNLGQLTFTLFAVWVVGVSIALARRPRPAVARAVAQVAA